MRSASAAAWRARLSSSCVSVTGGRTVGVAHESAYSAEKAVAVGAASESGLSNVMTGMPEMIVSSNIGCQSHLAAGSQVPVMHWIVALERRLATA